MTFRLIFCVVKATMLILTMLLAGSVSAQRAPGSEGATFRIAGANPLPDIVLPRLIPIIAADVSLTLGDATLINRINFVLALGMVDAAAPYHPSAVGVYTRLERQPETQHTTRNINIAMMHAAYHVLSGMLPERQAVWREMMTDNGLDPEDDGRDVNSPEGIGNAAGKGALAGRLFDGMNQTGDYADTTGYAPVNSAYNLVDASRWQPGIRRQGNGIYTVQQFVTPQLANTEPFASFDPREFRVGPPLASDPDNWEAYKRQADHVLSISAGLTDEEKMKAELFDNKILSLTYSYLHAAFANNLSPADFARGYLLAMAAALDGSITIWQEKARYDGVRPFSAVRHIYDDETVIAWGGPGRGRAEIPAKAWQSYLPEADHPEYPSGSTCGCYAHAQAMRRFLGTDALNWTVSYPAGSSRIEPGFAPEQDMELNFATWTDFARDCGQSRVWGGVHFQAAVDASVEICSVFGDMAFDYYQSAIDGLVPERRPAQALAPDPLYVTSNANAASRAQPPEATSPTPESCERVVDSVMVTSATSGFECQQVEIDGLDGPNNLINALELSGDLSLGVQVCFKGRGALLLLEESIDAPRLSFVNTYGLAGTTCAWIDQPGTLVLVPTQVSFQESQAGIAVNAVQYRRLDNCAITTTHKLNFRAAPDGGELLDIIPLETTLIAQARTDKWFNVSFRDSWGWVSADFVRTDGNCE